MKKSISIIIPFYDEINLIGRAVESVAENLKKHYDAEILICNDGKISSEEIQSKIPELKGTASIKIIKNIYPRGPGGNRNTGICKSSGDIIAFLDADDYWLPNKLDAQIQELEKGSNFIATGYSFDDSNRSMYPPNKIAYPIDMLKKRGILTSSICTTRELINDLRFADIRFSQDIDFWYRLSLQSGFSFSGIRTPYVVYSTGGSTKNKFVQLMSLRNVLIKNQIDKMTMCKVLFSYSVVGAYNHFIKKHLHFEKYFAKN